MLPTTKGRHRATFNNWNKKKSREVKYTSREKDYTKTLLIVLFIFLFLTLLVCLI